ncbi:MAG: hypothetical protein VR73_06525 [Gammaproteobacteria bacterium BRH_c0]|nr:MAG: hypothetical protein VR73_06525 [Gammaproteobacteria bacterium BRH_c0]
MQQAIAEFVAKLVVGLLEVVEINIGNADCPVVAVAQLDDTFAVGIEGSAIGETGEWVYAGQVALPNQGLVQRRHQHRHQQKSAALSKKVDHPDIGVGVLTPTGIVGYHPDNGGQAGE